VTDVLEMPYKRGVIPVRRFLALAIVLFAAVGGAARGASQGAEEEPSAELVLSGPVEMPLFRRGHGVAFRAVLVNRSSSPFLFVPPHRDWSEERQLEWQAVDAKGRWIDRLPNYLIWCDVHGVMRAERRDMVQVIGGPPKRIQDSDVVILQPGEQDEIAGLADPSFKLNFLKTGVYQLSLAYTFDPSRYELPRGSKNAAALKRAGYLSLTSNALTVALN
jgi:hypothetical protein